MIFTVDRLQFINNDLIAYEFIDLKDNRIEGKNYKFIKEKIRILKDIFQNNFFIIQYNQEKNKYWIKEFKGSCFTDISKTKSEFENWFNEKNNSSNMENFSRNSKPLGSATNNYGDPYVQNILHSIYLDDDLFSNVDFSNDDNGLILVESILNGQNTYGFDFDLFESKERIVIEFLKRESSYINNLSAHPNRYLKNYRKFLNLWKASEKIKKDVPKLFLVNYSDNPEEEINLIKVLEFNLNASEKNIGIESDISYKFSGYTKFIEWLKVLNINPILALEKLEDFPKEIRNRNFWKGFDDDICAKQIKKNIGKHYK